MLRAVWMPVVAGLVAGLVAGCGDLITPSQRVPTAISFEDQTVTVTAGEPVDLRPFVVDQDGRKFDRIPVWGEFSWASSDPSVFDVANGFLAVTPGQATAMVELAELEGRATVRVNPSSLAVAVPAAYLVQAVQRLDGTVPLVADRPATLRVFATGDAVNFFQPDVEVVFRVDGSEVGRRRVGLTRGGSIPREVDQGVFRDAWDVPIPGQWILPGLSFALRVDPDGLLPLAAGAHTRFPATGYRSVDVRRVPDFQIRFVPVHQTRFGSTGHVLPATAAAWTEFLEDVFPIAGIQRDVRPAFSTDAATTSGQTDWRTVIQEIWALRMLDGDDRYYYGVLRRHGGYAGLGYVGYPVAIGWDDFGFAPGDPVPLAYSVFAHELGHNFGRWHAPACGAGDVDPDYPYSGGVIGHYGLDHSRREIMRPEMFDLMGYCNPHWVSDYTFEGVLDFRLELEESRRRWGFERAAGPGLLVWGSVVDGAVTLEPAIAVDEARPTPPGGEGDLMVEGRDTEGRLLFRRPVPAMALSHGHADTRVFSAMVPLDQAAIEAVHTIRVTGPGMREGTREGNLAAAPAEARALAAGRAPSFSRARDRPGATELAWDPDRYPLVVVRDAMTGDVVAFARHGRVELPVPEERLTFQISDGVRSVQARPERR